MNNACRSIASQETKAYFKNIFYTNSKKDATGHFVMSEVHYCDIGGEPLTEANTNVDHDDPWTFNNIFNAFVESKGYDVNTLNEIQPECFKTKPRVSGNLETRIYQKNLEVFITNMQNYVFYVNIIII